MRHQLRISYYFWLGWNYFVREGVFYTTLSTKVAMFLFVTVDPQIVSCQILKCCRNSCVLSTSYISGYHLTHVFDTNVPSPLLFCIFGQYNTTYISLEDTYQV